jgi:cysteine desulfurase
VNSERIYLDHAATSPLRPEVVDAMRAAVVVSGFNPSSMHAEGRRARAVLDAARDRIAAILGALRTEIIFTSSGTESDNQALLGVARAASQRGHVVASTVEHPAVLAALEQLRDEGFEISLVTVDSDGRVDPAVFAAALRTDTVLASVMYANNETGTVQPIADLAQIARKRGVPFHTDAIAAPSWLTVDVGELGVDLLSLSAHKFGGPKGVGVLFVRQGRRMLPLIYGGGQEFGRRSGTENVAGIAGMACALDLATAERPARSPIVAAMRDDLEAGIRSVIPDTRINGAGARRLANTLNVSFADVDSVALLIGLDLAGVAVSAGSACTSGAAQPSHVLGALGLEARWLKGAIRFSLGSVTQRREIERVLELLPGVVAGLRAPAAAAC